ncbi:MAG TPA: group III truncated hemoglobin [Saprospiraceae bacterium]|nr:group III truncated hemoglobin [Saprospiraceae bacterium]
MKKDIENEKDIELLINSFYKKVRKSRILGFIFDEVARVHWESHLPQMYSFWGSLLLGMHSYTGNPVQKHIELSKRVRMKEIEFSEWLHLFTETVDECYEGEKAEEAKIKAANIARLMLHKIESV